MKTLVLMYHNVVNSDKDLHLYDVSLKSFKKQIECLRNTHDAIRDIILTFDDGYSFWANEALDIIKRNGLKAYFFVCLEFLKNGSITREDIIKLKKNGMIIGSHGMRHRFLHKLSEGEVLYELNESRNILEDIIQGEIEYFSVPRGVHNKKILKIAQDAGYKKIFISEAGLNTEDSFIMKRIPIRRDTSLVDFKNIVEGKGIRKQVFNQKMKDLGKRILGIENYNRIRKVLVPRAE